MPPCRCRIRVCPRIAPGSGRPAAVHRRGGQDVAGGERRMSQATEGERQLQARPSSGRGSGTAGERQLGGQPDVAGEAEQWARLRHGGGEAGQD